MNKCVMMLGVGLMVGAYLGYAQKSKKNVPPGTPCIPEGM